MNKMRQLPLMTDTFIPLSFRTIASVCKMQKALAVASVNHFTGIWPEKTLMDVQVKLHWCTTCEENNTSGFLLAISSFSPGPRHFASYGKGQNGTPKHHGMFRGHLDWEWSFTSALIH